MEFDAPHRRYNPLTDEYILVSPHRNKRPWLGQTEPPQPPSSVQHDPECYLCPGNTRAGGQQNPLYEHTFSFVNDYAAVLPPPIPVAPLSPHPLLVSNTVHGACDVLVFHPRHDLTLARLSVEDINRIVDEWIRIYQFRGAQDGIKYVQIFENKGSIMGCSNPHPHGQIWSLSEVPTVPSKEIASLQRYASSQVSTSDSPRGPKGRPCLLCEYAHVEIALSERVVIKNSHWVAVVPWWATWPFEILLLPYRRHIPSITSLTAAEKYAFADILAQTTIRYDNLFECSFAYSMGIHQRPIPSQTDIPENEDEGNLAHLHLHFTPPLLRNANIRKFLVGFELMAEAQRDLTPEQAADRLKACSDIHYLEIH